MSDEARPKVRMSEEEHGVLSRLATLIENLHEGQKQLRETLVKFMEATDQRFRDGDKRDELNWSKVGAVVLFALAIGSPLCSALSSKMETVVAPIVQKQGVADAERAAERTLLLDVATRTEKLEHQRTADHDEFVRTNTAQDIYVSLLWRQQFHENPPSVPLTK